MSDRDRAYRTREEEAEWRERDPIDRLARLLVATGSMTDAEVEAVSEAVEVEMVAALEFAERSPDPGIEEVARHVFVD